MSYTSLSGRAFKKLCTACTCTCTERACEPSLARNTLAVLCSNPALLASLDPTDAAVYEEMAVVQSVEGWERFRESALPGLRAFDSAAIERISGKYSLSVEPEVRSPKFDGPTLIITVRQDHVVGYQDQIAISGHYPRASIVVLDEAGHNAHLDQLKLIGGLLSEWLDHVENLDSSAR